MTRSCRVDRVRRNRTIDNRDDICDGGIVLSNFCLLETGCSLFWNFLLEFDRRIQSEGVVNVETSPRPAYKTVVHNVPPSTNLSNLAPDVRHATVPYGHGEVTSLKSNGDR